MWPTNKNKPGKYPYIFIIFVISQLVHAFIFTVFLENATRLVEKQHREGTYACLSENCGRHKSNTMK